MIVGTIVAPLACGGDSTTGVHAPNQTPNLLIATTRAAVLAVGDTLPLPARLFALDGAEMTGKSFAYQLQTPKDSLFVSVSDDGIVRARAASDHAIKVDVSYSAFGVTRRDIVSILVTATPIPGLTLSLANPSTISQIGTDRSIPVSLRSASVVLPPIADLFLQPGDDTLATINRTSNALRPLTATGGVWVHGTVNAYGTLLRDSLQYTFSSPRTLTLVAYRSGLVLVAPAANQAATIAVGATVTFQNTTVPLSSTDTTHLEFTFDDPSAASGTSPVAPSGNVAPLAERMSSRRIFRRAGTFQWTARFTKLPRGVGERTFTGTIIVQ